MTKKLIAAGAVAASLAVTTALMDGSSEEAPNRQAVAASSQARKTIHSDIGGVDQFYQTPSWMPSIVDSLHTPGSSDAVANNAPLRVTAETYAALIAAEEAPLEREWYMNLRWLDYPSYTLRTVPALLGETNHIVNSSRRFIHAEPYYENFLPDSRRAVPLFGDSSSRVVGLASSLLDDYPLFPSFGWTNNILAVGEWRKGATFACCSTNDFLLGDLAQDWRGRRAYYASSWGGPFIYRHGAAIGYLLQRYYPPENYDPPSEYWQGEYLLPLLEISEKPPLTDILVASYGVTTNDFYYLTNSSRRLIFNRLAAYDAMYAAMDRSYYIEPDNFGFDSFGVTNTVYTGRVTTQGSWSLGNNWTINEDGDIVLSSTNSVAWSSASPLAITSDGWATNNVSRQFSQISSTSTRGNAFSSSSFVNTFSLDIDTFFTNCVAQMGLPSSGRGDGDISLSTFDVWLDNFTHSGADLVMDAFWEWRNDGEEEYSHEDMISESYYVPFSLGSVPVTIYANGESKYSYERSSAPLLDETNFVSRLRPAYDDGRVHKEDLASLHVAEIDEDHTNRWYSLNHSYTFQPTELWERNFVGQTLSRNQSFISSLYPILYNIDNPEDPASILGNLPSQALSAAKENIRFEPSLDWDPYHLDGWLVAEFTWEDGDATLGNVYWHIRDYTGVTTNIPASSPVALAELYLEAGAITSPTNIPERVGHRCDVWASPMRAVDWGFRALNFE